MGTTPRITAAALALELHGIEDAVRGYFHGPERLLYVWTLLFLKWVSDSASSQEDGQPARESRKVMLVPSESRWEAWSAGTSPTDRLRDAVSRLEASNPELAGLQQVVSAARLFESSSLLSQAVRRFSHLRLDEDALANEDVISVAADAVLDRFASEQGMRAGEYSTPRWVANLLAALVDPAPGMTVGDPTCGSGTLLVAAIQRLRDRGEISFLDAAGQLTIAGEERNSTNWAICRLNLWLHGAFAARVKHGDTLRTPQVDPAGHLLLFDRILTNPPFSLKDWGQAGASDDPFGRFPYGIPPKSRGDLAFLQHILATLKPAGKAAVLLAPGVLFRGGTEEPIRARLVQAGVVEAIVLLPNNLFFGTAVASTALILDRGRSSGGDRRVLFVDASNRVDDGTLAEEILGAYRSFSDHPGFCRLVPSEEIAANGYRLNVNLYVQPVAAEPLRTDDLSSRLQALETERDRLAQELDRLLARMGRSTTSA